MSTSVPRVRFALVAALTVAAAASSASAETFTIDRAHSSIEFRIRHLVGRTTGRFGDFAGTIEYDPANPAAAHVEATIQVGSLDTDNDQRDKHLKSPDFFDAAHYPTIAFVSTKVTPQGGRLMVEGNLTLHGITRAVVLPVEVLGLRPHPMPQMKGAMVAGFAAPLVLTRSDYKVNSWTDAAGVLGDDVEVSLNIEADAAVPAQ